MLQAELLVIDDIGLRNSTENFANELYEVIDERANDELATIYTSNYPIDSLGEILSHQIASRIEGSSIELEFEGKDNRKGGLL